MIPTFDSVVRYYKDIGLWAVDRPPCTCSHATPFCRSHCYNLKLYLEFGHTMKPKDVRNGHAWYTLTGHTFDQWRRHTKHGKVRSAPLTRFRFCTRGEPFDTVDDVRRVRDVVASNPDVLFWIPTRGWRDPVVRAAIDTMVRGLPNARVMASIDPTNTPEEISGLQADGWSTMFFGDDNATDGRYLCPKTHHLGYACDTCDGGCFGRERVDVHLNEH